MTLDGPSGSQQGGDDPPCWWRASCSRRLEGHVEEFCRRFAVLETLRDHSESQCLDDRNSFIPIAAVAEHAREPRHLGDPASVFFAFELDREGHTGNVPSRRPSTKLSSWPRRHLGCQGNQGGNGLCAGCSRSRALTRESRPRISKTLFASLNLASFQGVKAHRCERDMRSARRRKPFSSWARVRRSGGSGASRIRVQDPSSNTVRIRARVLPQRTQ